MTLLACGMIFAPGALAALATAPPCDSPVFVGALDLGGGLAVAFRSVGSRWLELRGTAGFEVRQGDGEWHAANVSTVAEHNPSGSNVINLAPVPGLSRLAAITQVRYRCDLPSMGCVRGQVHGCSVYGSSGSGTNNNGSFITPARSFTGDVTSPSTNSSVMHADRPQAQDLMPAGTGWQASAAAVAPSGPATPPIMVWKGSGKETAAMTAVGLLNRHARRPIAIALFPNSNRHEQDEMWLRDALRSGDPLLTPVPMFRNSTNATAFVLAAVAAGAVKGRVLYNGDLELHSLPTALTLGGIHSAVVVDCGGAKNSSALCSANLEHQLPTKHDCRGQWANSKVATRWAIENILSATSDDDKMVFTNPSTLQDGYEVDLIVSNRLFAMFPEDPVDSKSDLASDGICIDGSESHELFKRAIQNPHWRGSKLLSIVGYNTGAL